MKLLSSILVLVVIVVTFALASIGAAPTAGADAGDDENLLINVDFPFDASYTSDDADFVDISEYDDDLDAMPSLV